LKDLTSGVSIKSLQNAAHAASQLQSVAAVPTHLPNEKVVGRFADLEKAIGKVPTVFADELRGKIDSVRDEVSKPMTPERSQKIYNAAAEIVKALSPARLISYRWNVPMEPEEIARPKPEAEKPVPPVSTPAPAPPPAPSPAPGPAAPPEEKIKPAPESKEPEKLISPPEKEEEKPAAPMVKQYPILKSSKGILSHIIAAVNNYLFTFLSSFEDNSEKLLAMEEQIKDSLIKFVQKSISETKEDPRAMPTSSKVQQEVKEVVRDFLARTMPELVEGQKPSGDVSLTPLAEQFSKIIAEEAAGHGSE